MRSYPEYDTKLHQMVTAGDLGNVEYAIIAITPRSTLTCQALIK